MTEADTAQEGTSPPPPDQAEPDEAMPELTAAMVLAILEANDLATANCEIKEV